MGGAAKRWTDNLLDTLRALIPRLDDELLWVDTSCLKDLLDAPCPACTRACDACGQPLGKGKFKCTECDP